MFSGFEVRYTENFACVICHVLAIVSPGTFTEDDHEAISDAVKSEFEATGQLRPLLKELSAKAKKDRKASYSVHYGAIVHNTE